MKKIKQHLLSPDDLYALSFYSDRASDSGYFSIHETAENDLPKKSDGQYGDPSITCFTDN
jgi:hypothetical protein